jgi:UDP-N-acetylglucosamine 2-epimerase (non-hydrolysing)
VAHVEAGLRTDNIYSPYPEEMNRRLADRVAEIYYAPTRAARAALLREGARQESILVTGNTVIDALQMEVARQRRPEVRAAIDASLSEALGSGWRERRMVLITGHRRESFGEGFLEICAALGDLARSFPDVTFVYPVHLNPNVQGPVYQSLGSLPNLRLTKPQPYSQFVALLDACHFVITDSGGVQEEAPGLGKPVLVMRDSTERPEGVEAGTVRLVGAHADRIVAGATELLTQPDRYLAMARASNPYGDGKASGRIVTALRRHLIG